MKYGRATLAALATLGLISTGAAKANIYNAEFSSTRFIDSSLGVFGPLIPSPIPSMSGSITFTAASLNSPVDTISAVSLVIAGHTYSIGDIAARYNSNPVYSNYQSFEFAANSQHDISQRIGQDNFYFTKGPTYSGFSFSVDGAKTMWSATNLVSSISTVPESNSLTLMLAGLFSALAYIRTKEIAADRKS